MGACREREKEGQDKEGISIRRGGRDRGYEEDSKGPDAPNVFKSISYVIMHAGHQKVELTS
jgi:hypothetical protein